MASTRLVRCLGRRLSGSKRSSRSRSAASSNTEDIPLGSQKNPIHVLTRDTPIGWAVIQKAVDEFDKDQIEGVKNDIDTLLVFIGLFSAVLTAFLVAAFALLQEDVPTATLTTLRQMSAQNANYTIQGDFIHSTSPAPTSFAEFEPTANAIRINDLWTASLIVSLITASFGILVKQWLREYMKFVTSFPQGRLRIRKFRRTGLETWKVLTIAACLPLLLQLALGLFFIGLCFYTAELHSSVRNTTLPLVAGWGFIFVFVTISPLFSAHCPYKTPALDSLVVAVRRSARMQWKALLGGISARAMAIYWDSSLRGRMAKVIYDRIRKLFDRLDLAIEPYDEVTAAKYEAGDLDIMADADELQGNDEIVGTAVVDALEQMTPSPEDIIRFLLQILQHRVPWEGDFNSEPRIIDCSMATTRALDSIHSILQQHLSIEIVLRLDDESNNEMRRVAQWTVALHLSVHLSHSDSDNIPSFLQRHVAAQPGLFAEAYASRPSSEVLKDILRLACQSCTESQLDLAQSLPLIKSLVEPFFRRFQLTDSFESADAYTPGRDVLNQFSLRGTVAFLIDMLRNDTAAQDGKWSNAHHDALSLIVKLMATDPQRFTDSLLAVWRMATLSKSDVTASMLLMSHIKSYPHLLNAYIANKAFSMDITALSRFAAAIETIATNSADQLTRLSVLRTCRSLAWSVCIIGEHTRHTVFTEHWRGVFAALALLVQAAPVLEDEADREADEVYWCFRWLHPTDVAERLDDLHEGKYLPWRAVFKPEESPIPDGFYVTLMQISIPTRRRFWRMRRLQEMTAEDREAAAKDIEPYLGKLAADKPNDSAAGPSTGRGEGPGIGGNSSERGDAPVGVEEPSNPGHYSEMNAYVDQDDEQDTAAVEEPASRNSEAAGVPDTYSPETVLPEAHSPEIVLPEAQIVNGTSDVHEGERDERERRFAVEEGWQERIWRRIKFGQDGR